MSLKKSGKNDDQSVSLELYRAMLRIRLAELRIVEIYPTDKIQSPVHLSIGQEAVAAGVCRALKTSDHVLGTYRGHALYLAKGGDIGRMFAELYGKETGCARGRGGSMHLVDPAVGLMGCSAIVGSTIPVAVGDALAARMEGRGRVAVVFFGDGALDEGVFFESANFAVLKNLPILFVCENNGYGIHSKVSDRRRQTELYRAAEGLGLAGSRHDGDDSDAVYKTASAAVEKLRRGGAPRLLEFTTHRWHEHVGPGQDYGAAYRRPGEEAEALKKDPLEASRRRLTKKFGVKPAAFERLRREADAEIERAVAFAESSPFPSPDTLLTTQYA
ncbi:MAG: thiamine pyrophosphate-dependent dehydrogenase E1 component subunit alpha [Elusimicrobia bacterium]|nr:thiamine pyrophosphate-dependent dehydrogenase E1 component subunit alpha [Elusimicrobiota bacterium]